MDNLPVDTSEFWKERLKDALTKYDDIRYSVFITGSDHWKEVQVKTSKLLDEILVNYHRILDLGCGYGALYDCLSQPNSVQYTGIDLSPELIEMAKLRYPLIDFRVMDCRITTFKDKEFDLTICRSIRRMIVNNLGDIEWSKFEQEIIRISRAILYIEFEHPFSSELVRC